MINRQKPWQHRAMRVVVIAEWVAIAIGIMAAIVDEEFRTAAYVASGLGAIWVLATTSSPLPLLSRPLILDTFTLGGVLLSMTAVALTGGADSPFFLLSLTPSILASLLGGFRTGMSAAVLSSALLMAVALAREDALGFAVAIAMLYLVLAATVAQIRRILVELETRAETAEASSHTTSLRLEQLETANTLLADLAEITGGQGLNPIDIGQAGLETIARRYPDTHSAALVNGESGPILVARHGTPVSGGHEHTIPLTVHDRAVGSVRLQTLEPLSEDEIAGLTASLRPLALAFANSLLLQEIATSAVQQERTRLARELHDEIGPSLASLGLSLDVALINTIDQREVSEHLEQLRGRVSGLVDEVRSTVSDLRSPSLGSLSGFVESLSHDLGAEVPLSVRLDERRPARPSLAQDLYRIVGEAVRNAARHSGASSIQVLGWIDFDRGRIVIEDNGSGFDPGTLPEGHYGVIGMRERSAEVGLRFNIVSSGSGTRVEIEWGGQ